MDGVGYHELTVNLVFSESDPGSQVQNGGFYLSIFPWKLTNFLFDKNQIVSFKFKHLI